MTQYDTTAWEQNATVDGLRDIYERTGWDGYRQRNREAIVAAMKSCDSVLDAGCFIGMYAEPVMLARKSYTGFDVTPKFVAEAERLRGPECKFYVADVRDIPAKDKSFDLVFCFGVLIHLDEMLSAITELWRIARKTLLVEISTGRIENGIHRKQTTSEPFLEYVYRRDYVEEMLSDLKGAKVEHVSTVDAAEGYADWIKSTLWKITRTKD